jgi:uncharacterized repeat protein (TIGR03806 family)
MILKTFKKTRVSISANKSFWVVFLFMAYACSSPSDIDEQVEVQEVSGMVKVSRTSNSSALQWLSEYDFFQPPIHLLKPNSQVFPYALQVPLFSDYADKDRFIYLPENGLIEYSDREVMEFTEGTVIIKNFSFPGDGIGYLDGRKIIETRLLEKKEGEWLTHSYIWNEDQTDAVLSFSGADVPIQTTLSDGRSLDFTYSVPSAVQCKSCHLLNDKITPIGPTARQLNSTFDYGEVAGEMNQLEYWSSYFGLNIPDEIDSLPRMNHYRSTDIDLLARAYLDINCGHCHRDGAPARNSGLNLHFYNQDMYSLGIMKAPVAAGKGSGGLKHDIVPGSPNESILVYRMSSRDPGAMMPEVGKSLVHHEGVELIASWIEGMNN